MTDLLVIERVFGVMDHMLASDVDPVYGFDEPGLDNAGLTDRFRDLELKTRRVEAEMALVRVNAAVRMAMTVITR